jgi:hypothetical protein
MSLHDYRFSIGHLVLNRVPIKNKEKTPYEEWIGRRPSLSDLRSWGCLAKVNVPINKKRKLGPKTMDCVFLGYAYHSIAYRFLVVKSEVPDMHENSLFESRDATFFENIFPMKDSHVISSLFLNETVKTTPESVEFSEHDEHTLESHHEEIHIHAPRRSKRQKTAKSFGDDFTVYLIDDSPKTITEAFSSPDTDDWKEAVRSGMDSILSNGTWELVERP